MPTNYNFRKAFSDPNNDFFYFPWEASNNNKILILGASYYCDYYPPTSENIENYPDKICPNYETCINAHHNKERLMSINDKCFLTKRGKSKIIKKCEYGGSSSSVD